MRQRRDEYQRRGRRMNAKTLARALGGCLTGSHWMAPCPTHEDRDPSLSIRDADDGKVLVHCHAGCDQSVVIGELRSRGLWNSTSDHCQRPATRQSPTASKAPSAQDDRDRTAVALRLWHAALPALGTPVATYLWSRCWCWTTRRSTVSPCPNPDPGARASASSASG